MSFLQDIEAFSKSKLKPVHTEIVTVDGRRIQQDSLGHVQVISVNGVGFVEDLEPDLQVGSVLPGLSIGSQDVAADLEILTQMRVTHIVNVGAMVDNFFPEKFTYFRAEVLDLPDTDLGSVLPQCTDFIDECIEQGGHVFIHCNAGVSRSATVCIAYLITCKSHSLQNAFDLVKTARPTIKPNAGFMQQLKQLEQTMKPEKTKM